MTKCTCSYLQVGTKTTNTKNLNPDCPLYGTNSVWYNNLVNKKLKMKLTVEQLIKKLQGYPKNYEVKVLDKSGYYYLPPEITVIGDNILFSAIPNMHNYY